MFSGQFGVSQREDDSEHFRKNPSIDSRRRHSGKEDCGAAETYAVCHGVNGKMSDLFCADLIFLEKERIHFRLENIFKADASDVCLKNTGLIAAVDFEKSRIALSYIVFIFI